MHNPTQRLLNRWESSPSIASRNFQFACAVSGILCLAFFCVGLAASGFIPPPPPSWDAEMIVQHYRDHHKGMQAGVILITMSGLFYLPLTAALSAQMMRIPGLHYSVSALQLASGAAGIFNFILPGVILGVASYRLDRPVVITQTLNDLFWFTAVMAVPTFMIQSIAIAYAVISDFRPKPLFPKSVAILNIVAPALSSPVLAIHLAQTGPIAWDGAVSFWVPACAFGIQIITDSICLARAAYVESTAGQA